uniref:Retrovirus-related Pol polyprotein from transposon TNT 1-94 n=1 Tax=Tanacetum cinerariifolium TaxID=118510 RepID=A0A699GHY3_TANCI|nr:retrovirus-related Pol polyprotein from transposon TNT 1-94 [Tanacetum cinerariifolium]
MKVEESLNVTFDERPPLTKLSSLVDDDVGEEEAIKNYTKVVNNNNEDDELIEVDEVVNIKDIIFGFTCQNLCDDFEKIMYDELEMSMMEELNFFLGLQIKQMEDEIFFNQSKYIKETLKKFKLEDSKPTKMPMSTEIKHTKDDEVDSVDSTKYRDVVPTKLTNSSTYKKVFISFVPRYNTTFALHETYHTFRTKSTLGKVIDDDDKEKKSEKCDLPLAKDNWSMQLCNT